jgi:hypothetical protein
MSSDAVHCLLILSDVENWYDVYSRGCTSGAPYWTNSVLDCSKTEVSLSIVVP